MFIVGRLVAEDLSPPRQYFKTPYNRANPTMNTTQRFPLMLELWMAFEHMLYKAPRGRDLFDAGRTRESEYEVLYNGAPGIANLWNTLLSRQTPHLQIVRRGQDARVHVIAESHVAIPNRLFF